MNILVVTLSNLGDVIMTTPVMMALKVRFPAAALTVVVGPRAKCVLEKSSDIARLVVYDKNSDLLSKVRFLRKLRRERYDQVVDLRNTAIPFLVSCKKRSPLFRKFTKINMRERHLEILEMMGMEPGNPPPFRFFDSADEISCYQKLALHGIPEKRGWILVAPGAASEKKRWGVENFREVVRNLTLRTGKKVFLIGAQNESPIADAVAKGMPGTVRILCGSMTFSETGALMSQAALVIANDSAVMHLGFELGVPTVGVFGPTNHEKYGHAGPAFRIAREEEKSCPCRSHEMPYAARFCFHGLKPEKVLIHATELLHAP